MLRALGIGPGDEVIVPPYTFVATINVVLLLHALPVFVDTDIETFQIDARKIAAAITPTDARRSCRCTSAARPRTSTRSSRAAARATFRCSRTPARRISRNGRAARSARSARPAASRFQASKNLNCGEGGAIITSDAALAREAATRSTTTAAAAGTRGADFAYRGSGLNLRLTEFQAALLLAQMTRLEEQAATREANAAYLTRDC